MSTWPVRRLRPPPVWPIWPVEAQEFGESFPPLVSEGSAVDQDQGGRLVARR